MFLGTRGGYYLRLKLCFLLCDSIFHSMIKVISFLLSLVIDCTLERGMFDSCQPLPLSLSAFIPTCIIFSLCICTGTATIVLLGAKTDANPDGFGTKVLAGFPGSQIDIHGAVRRPTWTVLGNYFVLVCFVNVTVAVDIVVLHNNKS